MITIQREMLWQVASDVEQLLQEHYQELCMHKHIKKLNPAWDRYSALESSGALVAFTVRDDGKLIGYSAFIVQPHIHYADLLVGGNDVLFLTKSHRQGRTGLRLIRFCEEQLEKLGVRVITWHAKPGTDLIPILERTGYKTEEVILGKILGG